MNQYSEAPDTSMRDAVYAEVIKHGSCTTAELMKATGFSEASVRRSVRSLRDLQMVYRAGFAEDKNGAFRSVVWRAGAHEDVPLKRAIERPIRSASDGMAAEKIEKFVEAHGPCGNATIAKGTGLSMSHVKTTTRSMADRCVLFRCGRAVERQGGRQVVMWATTPVPRRSSAAPPLSIPAGALRSVFVGSVNPWTGAPA